LIVAIGIFLTFAIVCLGIFTKSQFGDSNNNINSENEILALRKKNEDHHKGKHKDDKNKDGHSKHIDHKKSNDHSKKDKEKSKHHHNKTSNHSDNNNTNQTTDRRTTNDTTHSTQQSGQITFLNVVLLDNENLTRILSENNPEYNSRIIYQRSYESIPQSKGGVNGKPSSNATDSRSPNSKQSKNAAKRISSEEARSRLKRKLEAEKERLRKAKLHYKEKIERARAKYEKRIKKAEQKYMHKGHGDQHHEHNHHELHKKEKRGARKIYRKAK